MYKSSTIEGSSYTYLTKDLIVLFKHATYVYENVELEDYEKFRDAESQGSAINKYIKKYNYKKTEQLS